MRFLFRLFISLIGIFVLEQCSISEHKPIERIQDQKEKFYSIIEDTTSKKFTNQNYQSLAYGEMKIYKPDAFVQLDSIYSIKQQYLDNNDQIGLRKSGIEDLIPGYRAAAQEEVDKIQYEIEHIFQTEDDQNLHIYHHFFLFNYKDSLLSITPFIDFKIAKKKKDLFYKYLFGYHFVDDRNLYISIDEQNFINFFKQHAIQLIGSDKLQPFMDHVMNMMVAAESLHTVDYREIGRNISLAYFKKNINVKNYTIEKLGKLFEVSDNDILKYYELEIDWTNNDTMSNYKTIFKFSPYLERKDVDTKIIENETKR